jgi:hypothetical protein
MRNSAIAMSGSQTNYSNNLQGQLLAAINDAVRPRIDTELRHWNG